MIPTVKFDEVFQFKWPGVKVDWEIGPDGIIITKWEGVQAAQPSRQDFADACAEYEASTTYKSLYFNVDIMTGRIGQSFSGEVAVALAPYLSAIQAYGKAKNWAGFKLFLAALRDAGKATQQQVDTIHNIILEQGVNLDDF